MARGFLSGALLGGVVSVVGAGVLSVADDGPFLKQPKPPMDVPDAQAAAPTVEAEMAPKVSEVTAPEPAPAVEDVPATAPDTLAALAEEARQPAAAPVTGDAQTAEPAPVADSSAPAIAASENQAVPRVAAPGAAPSAPDADEVAVKPVAPAEPAQIDSTSPDITAPAVADQSVGEIAAQSDQPARVTPSDASVSAPEIRQSPDVATAPAPVDAETDVNTPAAPNEGGENTAQAASDEAPLPAPLPAPPEGVDSDGLPATEGPADPPKPKVTARIAPDSDTTRPSVGQPAATLVPSASARLPRVVGEEAAPETPAVAETSGNARPIERFAEPIELASDRPLMSIVLIDDGSGPIGAEVLDGFPYPITVAVDPASDTARTRAADYRGLGLEVMALSNLPEGARPQDVEVTLAANLSSIPEAVGILEGGSGGLQGSRSVSDQVAAILGQTGHGLVLFPKGLNAAATVAAKAGVPATTIFRDFDGSGQSPKVMRRFLDQAAFKARQENGVVMVGRLQPDTISALLLWGLQDRAAQVALVPVSMVLNR